MRDMPSLISAWIVPPGDRSIYLPEKWYHVHIFAEIVMFPLQGMFYTVYRSFPPTAHSPSMQIVTFSCYVRLKRLCCCSQEYGLGPTFEHNLNDNPDSQSDPQWNSSIMPVLRSCCGVGWVPISIFLFWLAYIFPMMKYICLKMKLYSLYFV